MCLNFCIHTLMCSMHVWSYDGSKNIECLRNAQPLPALGACASYACITCLTYINTHLFIYSDRKMLHTHAQTERFYLAVVPALRTIFFRPVCARSRQETTCGPACVFSISLTAFRHDERRSASTGALMIMISVCVCIFEHALFGGARVFWHREKDIRWRRRRWSGGMFHVHFHKQSDFLYCFFHVYVWLSTHWRWRSIDPKRDSPESSKHCCRASQHK